MSMATTGGADAPVPTPGAAPAAPGPASPAVVPAAGVGVPPAADTVPAAGSGLSSASARPRQRATGIALALGSSASNQAGAALGALAFPTIGPVGVVAVRQLVTALVLVPTVRPRLRGLHSVVWWPVVALACVFSLMNLSLYAAIDRIGLGLAVVLEFLGPLAVAIAGSRRPADIGCALLAGIGVVVLTDPGPATDVVGIALALVAAVGWACYILLNRALGQRLPGIRGTATAAAVTAGAWLPVAVVWFAFHAPTVRALALAAACGLLSSVVPYVSDLLSLRRVPAPLFGTVASVGPVWAALAGTVALHQHLAVAQWIGLAMIVLSNVVVTGRGGLIRGR
jgi:inner membrane transporter RhtA